MDAWRSDVPTSRVDADLIGPELPSLGRFGDETGVVARDVSPLGTIAARFAHAMGLPDQSGSTFASILNWDVLPIAVLGLLNWLSTRIRRTRRVEAKK